jgi:hypothetical protein
VGARQQRVALYYGAVADALESFEQGADRISRQRDRRAARKVIVCSGGRSVRGTPPPFAARRLALLHAYHAAERSELWRAKLADTLARWIVRINFSLIAEPARSEDGGDEGLLRNLLLASLNPCAQRGGRAETAVD